ncbi:MAG TPA: PDZ domain-containing protein [Planctomycetota bacterium]|nr:PDZ domain-containing protein [Planctomycetota bacterium]
MILRSFVAPASVVALLAGLAAAAQQPRLGITVEQQGKDVHIVEVSPNSPAASAGVSVDDILLKIDGTEIRDLDAFGRVMDGHKAGDEVRLTVRRDGETKSLTAKLDRAKAPEPEPERRAERARPPRPARPEMPALPPEVWATGSGAFLGVQTEPEDDHLTITHIIPNSAAERAGLRKGDEIVEADGKAVATTSELVKRIQAHKPGDSFVVAVKRDDTSMKIEAKLGTRGDQLVPMPAPDMPSEPSIAAPAPRAGASVGAADSAQLRAEIASLRAELARLKEEVAALRKQVGKK